MRVHDGHSPHGSPPGAPFSQLSAIARTRASVVLPTPRGPASRYPCATRLAAIAPLRVFETCDCTATSENFRGRYFRARAIIGGLTTYARRGREDIPDPRSDESFSCRCYLSVLTELES